jgi:uncharacterized repeat protein (TIGR03943 family)
MTPAIRRYVSAGVLTIWGVLLVYLFAADQLEKYLHPVFRPWTLISGLVLLLMAAGTIFLPQEDSDDHDCCGDGCGTSHGGPDEPGETTFRLAAPLEGRLPLQPQAAHAHACCGHDHKTSVTGGLFQVLVLTVPLLVATVASPGQFGAVAVLNRGYVQSTTELPGYRPYVEPALPTEDGSAGPTETKPSSDYLPRNAAGQILAQTVDLLYAAEEPVMREDFENKEVEMIGQYMPAKANNARGNRFDLVRLFVNCCASDAQPVVVSVESNDPNKPAEMSWVKVVGRATFPLEGGRRVPVVVADSVTPCEPPPESFIY